jgi:hypothetical protein
VARGAAQIRRRSSAARTSRWPIGLRTLESVTSADRVHAVVIGPAASVGRQVGPEEGAAAVGGAGGSLDDRGQIWGGVSGEPRTDRTWPGMNACHHCSPASAVLSMTWLHPPPHQGDGPSARCCPWASRDPSRADRRRRGPHRRVRWGTSCARLDRDDGPRCWSGGGAGLQAPGIHARRTAGIIMASCRREFWPCLGLIWPGPGGSGRR